VFEDLKVGDISGLFVLQDINPTKGDTPPWTRVTLSISTVEMEFLIR
jgi:hypothetical protein